MINFTPFTNRILASSVAFLFTASSFAQWNDGQAASKVLGQTNMTSNLSDLTGNTLSWPTQIIVDPVSLKMFVSDFSNNRVLRYANANSFANGATAEAIFGQADEFSGVSTGGADGLNYPSGLALDASGNLYVAEAGNNRVVRYNNAASAATHASASLVLGQPDFTDVVFGVTASKMKYPASVFIKGDTLWVSDGGNNRVLRFDNVSAKTNGANADGILGQPDYVTDLAGLAANRFDNPKQIYVTGSGDLWVADYGNNRVLKFPGAGSLAPSAPATVVLGQTGFTSKAAAVNATGLEKPVGVYGDPGDRLYVSSESQHRILVYNTAATITTGKAATSVLGQASFTTSAAATTAAGLNSPQLLFTNNRLWVSDRNNNRVLLQSVSYSSLPLTLTGFKARKVSAADNIEISWSTSEETDVRDFELQYSTDGVTFNKVISRQEAKNDVKNTYTYLHNTTSKNNYYRLKMNDKNGSTRLSPVVSVKNSTAAPEFALSPNPVKGGQLYVRSNDVQQVKVEIYDVAGRLRKSVIATTQVQPVDVNELSAGIYTARIYVDGTTVIKQFVKQ